MRKPQRVKRSNPNDLTDLRVGLYCRVSRDQDDDGKSTTDQADAGREWVSRVGAQLAEEYIEEGSRSASRFATKEREQFNRLITDVEAGKLDVVWVWAIDRSNRNLKVFAEFRDLFQKHGVWLSVNGRMHDPDNYDDWMMLGFTSIFGERYSEELSKNVTRGKRSSAHAGRRAGRIAYGYRAVYDRDGKHVYDEPDTFAGDGTPVDDSPAYVVREIYDRILAGESITSIRRDLNDRGLRTRRGFLWSNGQVRYIATNPTYIAKRVYQTGEVSDVDRVKSILGGVEPKWPPLIDTETFWAVHRVLNDPGRRTNTRNAPGRPRDGRAAHLLSSLARCAECDGPLVHKLPLRSKGQRGKHPVYFCGQGSCVGIYVHVLDAFVEKVIVRWLSDPDVVAELTRVNESATASALAGDVEQWRAELATLYRDAAAGRVSAMIATTTERGLLDRIADGEQRIQAAALPAVLRGRIGPQAEAGWRDLEDVAVKRQIIRAVAGIRVKKVGRRGNVLVPARDRVEWTWRLGPGRVDESTG